MRVYVNIQFADMYMDMVLESSMSNGLFTLPDTDTDTVTDKKWVQL